MLDFSTRLRVALLTFAAAILLVAAGPGAGAAQVRDSVPPDSTVYRVPGISVEATRPVTRVGGASATEIEVSELRLRAAPTTAELLDELPALHLRTNSRGQAEIAVRGSGSRQVAVIVDGVPLTLGWDARTDVSVFPAGAVTDVTFTRGLGTVLQGPNVLGGVVEMSLGGNRVDTEPSLSAAVAVDHRGGYSTSAIAERPFETGSGHGWVRFGLGWDDSPGFPLPGSVTEPVETDGLRLNTDRESLNGFLAARWESDDGPWGRFSASSFSAERGIGAEIGAESPRLWRYPEIDRTVVAVSGGTGFHDTGLGRGDLEFSVGFDTGGERIRAYESRAYDRVTGIEDGDDRTTTLRLTGDHTLGSRGDLAMAFTWSDIRHTARVADEPPSIFTRSDYRQTLLSLAAETRWTLVESRAGPFESLDLSLGGAWDRGSTPQTGGLPSLETLDDWGARVGVSALVNRGRTMLHAGLSRRGRFPSLRESYSEALNRFVPNPDLRPERLVAFEAGVTTRLPEALGEGELQVVGFRQDLDGAIRRITFGDGMRQRVNAGELESTGMEVILAQSLGRTSFGGDLTLQSVRLSDPGSTVSTRPENLPEQMGRLWIEHPILGGFRARAEAEYTGTQYCQDPDTGADVALDGATRVDASFERDWSTSGGRRFETTLSVENLGDTVLWDQCGLPRAGRLLRLSVRAF